MKNLYIVCVLLTSGIMMQAQIRISNNATVLAAANSSAFIDASSNPTYNTSTNAGKGLLFPAVDLSTFTNFGIAGVPGGGNNYPTFYDGMIVYNTNVGGKVGNGASTAGSTEGKLTRGYWYYDNPVVSGQNRTLTSGTWKPLASKEDNSKVIINSNVENTTNLVLDGSPVYAYKGKFNMAAGSTAKVDLQLPDSIKEEAEGLYRITIYQQVGDKKKYYANGVYSLDVSTGLAVTGSPGISSRYPNGTYEYVIEYLKKAKP